MPYFCNKVPNINAEDSYKDTFFFLTGDHLLCGGHFFQLWCWWRLLGVPWTARRSNQSILKEISPEYSHWNNWCWSWSSNTLATWCEELTHLKRPWCWERLRGRGQGADRGWDGDAMSPTQWTWVWVNSGVGDTIQASHPPLFPSPVLNLSQHQGLSQWVSSSHQVAKVLELLLQHHSFQ